MEINEALRQLETLPHPKAYLSKKDVEFARAILDWVDSEDPPPDGIRDASVNLDRYIYG